jgi:hypothetical protein
LAYVDIISKAQRNRAIKKKVDFLDCFIYFKMYKGIRERGR